MLCAAVGLNGAGLLFSPRYRAGAAKIGGAVMLVGLAVVLVMGLPKGYALAAWLLGILAPSLFGSTKDPLHEIERRVKSGEAPEDAARAVRERLESEQPEGDLFGRKTPGNR